MLPSVSQMLWSLLEFAPYLSLLYDNSETDDQFWVRLEHTVSGLTNVIEVPSPKRNFPEFVRFMYHNLSKLQVSDPKRLTKILEQRKRTSDAKFFLWKLPDVIGNLDMFFDTLAYMKAANSIVYRVFIMATGNADLLFDRYLPQISATSPVSMINFLTGCFTERARAIANTEEIAEKFFTKLIRIVNSPNLSLSVEAFRSICVIFMICRSIFSSEHHARWMTDIIRTTLQNPLLRVLAINFCIEMQQSSFNVKELLEVLMESDSGDGWNLLLLGKVIIGFNLKNPTPVAKFLFEKGTTDAFLSVTCSECVVALLEKYGKVEGVHGFIEKYTRRCFLFIGASSERNKYHNRRHTMLCFYESLLRIRCPKVSELVKRYYSTIVNFGFISQSQYAIPTHSPADITLKNEIEMTLRRNMPLKALLQHQSVTEEVPMPRVPSHSFRNLPSTTSKPRAPLVTASTRPAIKSPMKAKHPNQFLQTKTRATFVRKCPTRT